MITPLFAWSGPFKVPRVKLVAKRLVAVSAVVDAYGNIDASDEVEVMFPARKKLPCTERAAPGDVVPMPRLPPLNIAL